MRRLAALVAIVAALVGCSAAGPAAARVVYDCPAANGLPAHNNNGSGCLGTGWTALPHGQYGNLAGPDVMLVGDSITTRCKAFVTSRLDAQNLTWGVSYWSGRPTQAAVNWVLSLSVKPKVVWMETGTNDIYNTPAMATQIQRLVDGLARFGTRIMWQDVRAERPPYAIADMANSRAVNAQIWGNSDVTPVKWIWWFDQQPSRRKAYIDAGGVHPIDPTGCDFLGAATTPTVIGAAKAAKLKASKPR